MKVVEINWKNKKKRNKRKEKREKRKEKRQNILENAIK